MSSNSTLRQIGLLTGLAASVAVGAVVVLWLWIPGGGETFSSDERGFFDSPVLLQGQGEVSNRFSFQKGYRDNDMAFITADRRHANDGRLLTLSGIQLEYTQNLETSYTRRIERLLEPLLGADSIRAQVTADIDFTTREQTLETYDPDSAILRSNEVEEKLNNSTEEKEAAEIKNVRRAVNNYELDKTIRFTRSAIGRIDKLYIAVIVDDKITRGVKGNKIRTPRTDDELVELASLVKKSVGFNAKRGDIVNVMGASFKINKMQRIASASPTWGQIWAKDLFNKMLGSLLVLLLVFAVIRPAMKSLVNLPTNLSESDEQYSGGDLRAHIGSSDVNTSGNYEKNMITAAQVVERDPKLVAQIMKNWVSADGS